MSDLIKREDAIRQMALMLEDISEDLAQDILDRFGHDTAEELATEAMSIIPSADRPQGEWIMHIDDLFPCESTQECSICHAEQLINGNDDNFCPNCGAKMKGADDEV